MPTAEEFEKAKQALLDALGKSLQAEVPTEYATLPRVTELQIERQWVDEDTGYLMASGVAIFADGRRIDGDLGRLIPVVRDGVPVGYRLATLDGQPPRFGTTDCTPAAGDDIFVDAVSPGDYSHGR